MALVLNEEQIMLKESAGGFLAENATVSHLRALRDAQDERGFDPGVWQEMVAMGWSGIAIDEAYGGLGYGYTGLGLVLEQVGRNLSTSPLQSTVLVAAPLIGELGSTEQKSQSLSAIAAGEKIISLALQEGPHHAPADIAAIAAREGEEYVLNGHKVLVHDGAVADAFIVVARTGGQVGDVSGVSAFLVPGDAQGLSRSPRSFVDSRGVTALAMTNVRVSTQSLLGEEGAAWNALQRCLDIANIGLAAELLGIAQEAFERTIGYLQERQQFGRVIGSFQGLQHRAAQLFAELELARSIVLRALHAIDAGEEGLSQLASATKAKLCEVAERATNEAIQMHGGIGMTDEHEIGFFLKRARVAQHTYGDYNYHLDRFAALNGF